MSDEHGDGRRWRAAAQDSAKNSATITVLVDERGAVSDVVIPAQWRDVVRPHELGRALLEAVHKAIVQQVASQVEQLNLETPVERPMFSRWDAPSAGGDPTSPVAQRLVNELRDLFSRFDAELEAYAAQVRQAATATHRSEGVNRRIVVTVAAGQVAAVNVDVRWASVARHTEIRAEAMSAFQAAWWQAGTGAIPLPPSITRLQELTSDPAALSRQLGLSR